jgi:hypothetical protein
MYSMRCLDVSLSKKLLIHLFIKIIKAPQIYLGMLCIPQGVCTVFQFPSMVSCWMDEMGEE